MSRDQVLTITILACLIGLFLWDRRRYAERALSLGRERRMLLPLGILAVAVALSAFELAPAQVAFVGAAVALVLFGLVTLKEAYAAVEWPILVLIGALIPLGEAVQHNGTAQLIAAGIAGGVAQLPSYAILAALLAVTMLITPILHHAAAVLVMGRSPRALRNSSATGWRCCRSSSSCSISCGSSCSGGSSTTRSGKRPLAR